MSEPRPLPDRLVPGREHRRRSTGPASPGRGDPGGRWAPGPPGPAIPAGRRTVVTGPPAPSPAEDGAMASAQANWATSGRSNGGRSGSARENVPCPVHESRPMKTSVPMPGSRIGRSSGRSIGPPMPTASISRNAPLSGEPKRALMAAKLPAAATTASNRSGASRRASRTVAAASPPPIAISGASGPTTAPKPMLTTAARVMPSRGAGAGGPPPGWNPSRGDSPPRPGTNRIRRPTSRPAVPSSGRGHHAGTGSSAKARGRSS
jgi:hypothetical protein